MESQPILRLALLSILLNSRLLVAAGSAGDDFTNNLFTDLAPLLGLFGEQFAKQFLSESFTLQERILFAMAPLGVLTAIVGAIRVGGANWLKRLIGRARENFADAEIELMSSVSKEVCELWNGTSIVRSRGNPEVKQIIHLPTKEGDISPESFITMNPDTWSTEDDKYRLTTGDTIEKDIEHEKSCKESSVRLPEPPSEDMEFGGKEKKDDIEAQNSLYTDRLGNDKGLSSNSSLDTQKPNDTADNEYEDMPPNMSLNIHSGSNPVELWVYAIIATGLQIGVLVWSWNTANTSFAQKHNLTASKPLVGLWLQIIGTVLLTLNLIVCAGIIDNGSCERRWSRSGESQLGTLSKLLSSINNKFQALANKSGLARHQSSKKKPFHHREMQFYWLQKQHTVSDNIFDSHILYAEDLSDYVLESHRVEKSCQINQKKGSNTKMSNKKMSRLSLLKRFPRCSGQHLTTFAAVFGILGFVAQFQGLRFSNWTCSVGQLIALGVATILRAWVRRGLTKTPVAIQVDNDYILDHLTLAIVGGKSSGSEFPDPKALRTPGLSLAFGVTTTPKLQPSQKPESKDQMQQKSGTSNLADSVEKKPSLAQQAINLRARLSRITEWVGPRSQEAIILSNSIETVFERLSPRLPFGKECAVVFQIDTCRAILDAPPTSMPGFPEKVKLEEEEVELKITEDGGKWKVDDAEVEALLSLISYSAWAAEKDKNLEGKQRKKSLAHSESLGDLRFKGQSVEKNRFTGRLGAKALDSQTYDKIVGKSNPKLFFDLFWWISDARQVFKEVKTVEPLTLGFYVNDKTVEESDTFLSSKCIERQAFILHLFSAFIWAIADHLSAQDFYPTTVISSREEFTASDVELLSPMDKDSRSIHIQHPQLKSDIIETLVQELQSIGLGTSKEIYEVLIPPLSHFDKLPNEAVADWCNESLIKQEASLKWQDTFDGYQELLETVQRREVHDRFSNRAAAMVIGFLLRMNEDPKPFWPGNQEKGFNKFNKKVKGFVENKNGNVLKTILSLEPILVRQRKIQENDRILTKLGFKDLQLKSPSLAHASVENDFTFPNATDVFGWTKEYWNIFYDIYEDKNGYKTLDLAGQSVLHHVVDLVGHLEPTNDDKRTFALAVRGFDYFKLLEDKSLHTAKCNNQTPLHRVARTGEPDVVKRLFKSADVNAADSYGRTALCLAAHHGNSDVIDVLCEKTDQDGLDRTDRFERNALHYAILNRKEKAALNLIERKINFNSQDSRHRTPLWYAAQKGIERVVEALLKEENIEVDVEGWSNRESQMVWISAAEEAERAGHTKIANMIAARKALPPVSKQKP